MMDPSRRRPHRKNNDDHETSPTRQRFPLRCRCARSWHIQPRLVFIMERKEIPIIGAVAAQGRCEASQSRRKTGQGRRFKPSFHRAGEPRHGTDRPTEGNPFLPVSELLFRPSCAPTRKIRSAAKSPHPHLQIRHRGPDVALGPFGDLAGDSNRSSPPPGEECRENLVFRRLKADRLEAGLETLR